LILFLHGDNFKVTGHTLPKNVLPGLDFYNGVMMAVDSLTKRKNAFRNYFL
jgi:hypothetical protein